MILENSQIKEMQRKLTIVFVVQKIEEYKSTDEVMVVEDRNQGREVSRRTVGCSCYKRLLLFQPYK